MSVWILVLVLLGSLTVYEVGRLGVIVSISLGALIFLYRKYIARNRAGRPRRLLP